MRAAPWLTRAHAWPALLLLICLGSLATGLYPALTSRASFAPSHDTTWLTSPMLCEIGRQFSAWRIPLMDWTTFEPVSHNLHLSPLYPFYFAGLLDYCTLGNAVAAHDTVIALHLFIMFGNAVLLGRAAGLSWTGALLAGFLVAASSNALMLGRWPTLVAAASWLPMAAAGVVAVVRQDAWWRGSALVVAGVSLMLMANPATNLTASLTFFGLVVGAGALVAAASAGAPRSRVLPWVLCGAGSVLLIGLLSLGTAGNALLALDDLIRWNRTGHVIGRQVTNDFMREILAEQQGPRELLSVLLPMHIGFVAGSFFLGAIAVALAALGALDGRREWLTRSLVALVVIVLVFMFLDPGEWVLLWAYIPGLNHTRHLSLLGSPFVLAMALLAGRGLEVVLRPGARRARRGLAITLALAALLAFPVSQALVPARHFPDLLLPVVVACGLLAALLFLLGNRLAARNPQLLAAGVLLACAVLVTPQLSSRMIGMEHGPVGTRGWEDLSRLTARILTADPEPGVVIFHADITADGLHYTTAGTAARLLGAPSFQYFHSPRVHWQFFAVNYRFPDYAYYARLGARYMLAEGPVVHEALQEVGREGDFFAYRLRDSRPLVVPLCGALHLPAAAHGGRRPRRSQLHAAPPALMAAAQAADAVPQPCARPPVTDIRLDRGAGALRFHLELSRVEALVLNVPPHAGWRLTIGHRVIPVFALDDSRSVVALPPGAHGAATLSFRPAGVILRLSATLGGWALLLTALGWWGFVAWRRRTPASNALSTKNRHFADSLDKHR